MAYTMKLAKEWFIANPRSKVIHHRRMKELGPSSRERLEMPREAKIVGTRVCFSDGSELSLRTDTNTSNSTNPGLLDIMDGDGIIIVTYAAAPNVKEA